MKINRILTIFIVLLSSLSVFGQQIEVSSGRKNVRTSGDIMAGVTPVACIATVLILQDWTGMKQGALAAATTLGVSYGLKYLVGKERPDKSDDHSFPSLHTSISFTGAAFIQKRYGWKWGIPAYAVASYVGWSRVHSKKHDWWDVAAGAAIGIGSAYIFTHPYLQKNQITLSPIVAPGHCGIYASMTF